MTDATLMRWQHDLDELTRLYEERLSGLGVDELNWKPAPDVWSIGQTLEHVMRTNESYYPVVDRIRRRSYRVPWIGRIPLVPRLIGNLVLKGVEPERRRKVRTFPVWEPTASGVSADVVERFRNHQTELKRFIADCEDLVACGRVISSPASRYVVYPLDKAFDILVAHERRHLNQAEETLALLRSRIGGGPAAPPPPTELPEATARPDLGGSGGRPTRRD